VVAPVEDAQDAEARAVAGRGDARRRGHRRERADLDVDAVEAGAVADDERPRADRRVAYQA
jgi:hypothetical protein